MEELQRVFSRWSADDLSAVLRLSDGDCGRAVYAILHHDRTGLPAGMLIRFLGEARARSGKQQRRGQQQLEGCGVLPPPTSGVSGTDGGRSRDLFNVDVPAHTLPSYEASVLASLWQPQARGAFLSPAPTNIGASGYDEEATDVPCSSESKKEAVPVSQLFHDVERTMPREPCQLRRVSSAEGVAEFPSHSSPPEVLLQRLSPDGKDRLLLQLLSSRGQMDIQAGQDGKTDWSARETDMINVQIGILMSLKKEENLKSLSEDNTDDEALEFGIRASKQAFQEYCRIDDQEKKNERTLIEHAKSVSLQDSTYIMSKEECIFEKTKQESLACSNFILGEDCLIEQVKRESLVPKSFGSMEELLIEEAKQKSLACPPPVTKEEHRLIEHVKQESLTGYTYVEYHGRHELEGSESSSQL